VRELRGSFATGTVYLVIFTGITVLEFVGLLELHFEEEKGNIKTAGDALWWGYVTATTVGYGDYYPVTTCGRLVGWIMLTVGVALFATFSGYLANKFLSAKAPEAEPAVDGDTRAAVDELLRLLAEQRRVTEQLQAQLAELDA
jgi:voltage-gated potassium channel Kch